MSLTTLDPKTALVIIDLQKGILALSTAHPVTPVLENAARLAKSFRAAGRPVVLVNVVGVSPGRTDSGRMDFAPPPEWFEIAEALEPQADDVRISKQQWGAFYGTALDLELRRRGVTQIVLCGVATSIGVESTAREAFSRGYNVTLAVDAMTDLHTEAHDNSIARIFPRLGETGTTAGVIALLEKR